jgi:hypothetical protein
MEDLPPGGVGERREGPVELPRRHRRRIKPNG